MNTIVLFRNDLRMQDNPALVEAGNSSILPVFVYPVVPMGNNSQHWLEHSLYQLNETLNGHLVAIKSIDELFQLIKKHNIERVFWNRRYSSIEIEEDSKLKTTLKDVGIIAKSFNASLIFEPWTILKPDNSFYAVYTPFYKKCLQNPIREPYKTPKLSFISHPSNIKAPKKDLLGGFKAGEIEAYKKLEHFLENKLSGYQKGRDYPSLSHTSYLSPHLRFGEISPHQIWHAVKNEPSIPSSDRECFLKELIWREFSYYQLYHFPKLPEKNWNQKFDHFPWKKNTKLLEAWQQGKTGIPIVDAAMIELITTGYMHNRMRMVTASFLTKNLLIHWKYGEKWFYDHLYDADYASNNANWQWVSGTGFDAAPYFRIFNPILQAKKFDKDGTYIQTYLPKLTLKVPYLFEPTPELLKEHNISTKNYPIAIIDVKASAKNALNTYNIAKKSEK